MKTERNQTASALLVEALGVPTTEHDAEEYSEGPAREILGETEAYREADAKHFINTDKSFTAVEYPYPVHYRAEAEGAWLDIDNTPVLTDAGTAPELARALGGDKSVYVPKSSPIRAAFAQNSGERALTAITSGGYTLSWQYAADEGGKATPLARCDAAVIEPPKDGPWEERAEYRAIRRIQGGLVYRDVLRDTDLEIRLCSDRLEESLVLKTPEAARSWRIRYDPGELTARQDTPREIALLDKAGETVFTLSAPYMTDAAMAGSDALTLEILSAEQSELTLSLRAESAWLDDPARKYPVRIDPYVFYNAAYSAGDATFASNGHGENTGPGTLAVGNDMGSYYGIARTFVRFDLPTLKACDVVTNAQLVLHQFPDSYGFSGADDAMIINAYKVTSAWDASVIGWTGSESDLPSVDGNVIDYQSVCEHSEFTDVVFNISKTVKEWYEEGGNYGICLKQANETLWNIAKFARTTNESIPPTLAVNYLNSQGLEARWTNHVQSLGRSGSGYVCDYTGNLVFITPVLATTGNRMPVSISLVYDGSQRGNTVNRSCKVGRGWRLNVMEKLLFITDESSNQWAPLYSQGYRTVWEDCDGTQHFFKLKQTSPSIVMEDDEGLGLTLTVIEDYTDLENFVIESATGEKRSFTPAGNLRRVYDKEGNYFRVQYHEDGRLYRMQDGAGRQIYFNYCTEEGFTDRIASVKDPANRVTSFSYSEYNSLLSVTYPDGAKTRFGYNNSYQLTIARGTDDRRIRYGYPSSGGASVRNRVVTVREFDSTDTVQGNSLTIDYSGLNRTKFTDNRGREEIYQFDHHGRTTGIADASGNNRIYRYMADGDANNKTANALTAAGVGQRFVNNRLRNHAFEYAESWYLIGVAEYCTSEHYLGYHSMKLTGAEAYAVQTLDIVPNYSHYTFSAYVKTNAATTGANVSIRFLDAQESVLSTVSSNPIDYTTDWRRLAVSAKAPEGTAKVRVRLRTTGAGSAWFDCTQLETGLNANAYNLVENGSFNDDPAVGVWTTVNAGPDDGIRWDGSDGYYRFTGESDKVKAVKQSVKINRTGNKTFLTVSASARGISVPPDGSRQFAVALRAHYTNGTVGDYRLAAFNPDYSAGWQRTAATFGFNTSRTIDYVEVVCFYSHNANYALFDNVQVNLDETGVCYTYDENGNLITVTDNAARSRSYTYSTAHEMTRAETADNKLYDFTYSSTNRHRLIKATSAKETPSSTPRLEFSFAYDDYGNLQACRAQNASGKYIRRYTAYTEDGNYVSAVYTDLGEATQYEYDSQKGTLDHVTDPRGNSTYYTYNANNDRLLTVSDSSDPLAAGASTVSYTYNGKGYLTGLSTPSTAYTLTYNGFGRPLTVKAGTYTLSTNTYGANNGNLLSVEYGNGFTVGYTYDSLDRPVARRANGTLKFEWSYNAENRLGRHWDYVNGKNYAYLYDLLGRPLRTDVSDGNWIRCDYDPLTDKVSSVRYSFNGTQRLVSYGYAGADNLPSTTSFSSFGKVTNSYDSMGRLYLKFYQTQDEEAEIKAEYSYFNWTTQENRTSGKVRGIDYTFTSGLLSMPDLYYTYDSLGNIATERLWWPSQDNPLREKYTYDAKNQLVRHDSVTQNASFTYEYDKAGNITARKRYAYTTGTLGTPTETRSYVYGNSSWGDLLTSYDGHAITYDGMGNMTSYNGQTYSWNGRELSGISGGGNTYSYKYNAQGFRTSKTVNGTTTEYFLNGSQLLAQKTGDTHLWFFYDSEGNRVGLISGGLIFYYLYNVQGDVVAIVRASTGQIVARYSYDAWGNCTVTNAEGYITGTKNPFRYRGYYYDAETGMYYLGSRYYDPELGRFISPDVFVSTGQGLLGANMFAYCNNNPVCRKDREGFDWESFAAFGTALILIGVAAAAIIFTGGTGAVALAGMGVTAGVADATIFSGITVTIGALIQAVTSGGKKPTELGKEGERQAGINQSEKKSYEVNGRTRTPDHVDSESLTEVKNVKTIYRTLQIKDYENIAQSLHLGLKLVVRSGLGTRVSRTIIDAGWEIIRLIVNGSE